MLLNIRSFTGVLILTSLLVPVGGNLVADTAFRKKLAGRDTGVELQIVLEDLVASWPAPAPAPDTAAARWVCGGCQCI